MAETKLSESQIARVVDWLVHKKGYDPTTAEQEVRAGKWDSSRARGAKDGRPPKLRRQRVTVRQMVRFTQEEFELVCAAVGDETVGAWARRVLVEAARAHAGEIPL